MGLQGGESGPKGGPHWEIELRRAWQVRLPASCRRLLPPPAEAHCRLPSSPMQFLALSGAIVWLVLCTWMFHGALEVQLSSSSSSEMQLAAPADRPCEGLFKAWCEQRVDSARAAAVKAGMLHAWKGYKAFAWGADEIHPQSKTAKTDIMVGGPAPFATAAGCGCCPRRWATPLPGRLLCPHPVMRSACLSSRLPACLQGGIGASGMGVSIVDALSTLKVMGLHKEFAE